MRLSRVLHGVGVCWWLTSRTSSGTSTCRVWLCSGALVGYRSLLFRLVSLPLASFLSATLCSGQCCSPSVTSTLSLVGLLVSLRRSEVRANTLRTRLFEVVVLKDRAHVQATAHSMSFNCNLEVRKSRADNPLCFIRFVFDQFLVASVMFHFWRCCTPVTLCKDLDVPKPFRPTVTVVPQDYTFTQIEASVNSRICPRRISRRSASLILQKFPSWGRVDFVVGRH